MLVGTLRMVNAIVQTRDLTRVDGERKNASDDVPAPLRAGSNGYP